MFNIINHLIVSKTFKISFKDSNGKRYFILNEHIRSIPNFLAIAEKETDKKLLIETFKHHDLIQFYFYGFINKEQMLHIVDIQAINQKQAKALLLNYFNCFSFPQLSYSFDSAHLSKEICSFSLKKK